METREIFIYYTDFNEWSIKLKNDKTTKVEHRRDFAQ